MSSVAIVSDDFSVPPSRWTMLAVLFLTRLCMGFQFQALPVMAPLMVRELGLSYTEVGFLIGVFMAPGILIAIPTGLLAARVGDKAVALLFLAVMALGGTVAAAAGGMAGLTLGRMLSGMGAAMSNVQVTKMATDWFEGRELATAMGIVLTSWPLGMGLSVAILGQLAATYGWAPAMAATVALPALALLAVALVYRDPGRTGGAASRGGREPVRLTMPRAELLAILLVSGMYAFSNAGFIAFVSFAPSYLVAGGYSVATAGLVLGLSHWTRAPLMPLGGWLMDRTGRMGLIVAVGYGGAALGIIALAPLLWWPWLTYPLIGVFVTLPVAPVMTLPSAVLPPERRRLGFGIFYTALYSAYFAFPTLAGLLQDLTGHPATPLYFGGAVLLLAVGCYLALVALRRGQTTARGAQP
ncbi:MAG: MFS transporter [Candidatus Lambdaproteobacteria bacterium]|nr:MFS transporter [Candidatus Lambdaproteobacteria bacterium]